MPYITTVSNTSISQAKRESIKAALGQHAALLGKSEQYLMVDFRENSPLYFQGSDAPAAILSVDLYGAAGKEAYNSFTAAATQTLSKELDVPASRIFVKYAEYTHWGWNGVNF